MTIKPRVGYLFSIAGVAATVSALNYLALYNPVGSGKLVVAGAFFLSNTMLAPGVVPDPLRGFRFTGAPSGGVLQDPSATTKFDTAHPDPAARIYTGNPTVTLGNPVFNSPPGVDKRSSAVHIVEPPPGGPNFVLRPGEGIVLRTGAGDVNLFWNITSAWVEL